MRTKTILLVLTLSWGIPSSSQPPPNNVLSYYAVNNSLDGQLIANEPNSLRFFPVFVMRNAISSVKIVVYYGNEIYSRQAASFDEGSYWEAPLPPFQLGDAIQRIDVEVHSANYLLPQKVNTAPVDAAIANAITRLRGELNAAKVEEIQPQLDALEKKLSVLFTDDQRNRRNDTSVTQTITRGIFAFKSDSIDTARCRAFSEGLFPLVNQSLSTIRTADSDQIAQELLLLDRLNFGGIRNQINQYLKETTDSISQVIAHQDTLRHRALESIYTEISDTNRSGPSIRKSDIVLDYNAKDNNQLRVLYRNYKESLRRMPALDPAERIGIFRARYIPFAFIGGDKSHLWTSFDNTPKLIFEVGISFSNYLVAEDEVVPQVSLDRLGVAFAFDNSLFSENANTRAVALTYDFNSFGSLGIGANFTKEGENDSVHLYLSFGINKRLFEALMPKLASLFN